MHVQLCAVSMSVHSNLLRGLIDTTPKRATPKSGVRTFQEHQRALIEVHVRERDMAAAAATDK